ncbi:MAG: diguanylate cyclase [Chloroflexota bacterium]
MPRLTSSAFRDLAIWMIGLGLMIGFIFPPFTLVLGLPASSVLTVPFFVACLTAGLMVGGINYALARFVVGSRVRQLAARMEKVRTALQTATYSGDWSTCTPEQCLIDVDSTDEFGDSASSFNELVLALSSSNQVEEHVRALSATLSAHLELGATSQHALRHLMELTGVSAGALLIESDGTFSVAASVAVDHPERLTLASPILESLRSDAVVRLEAPADIAIDAAVALFPARSVLVVPLAFKSVPVGVLVLAHTSVIETDSERLVRLVRPILSVALNNALAHERIQRLATIDGLTGTYNRRFGLTRLREEYKRAIRAEMPLSVAMFDIDHFKAVNDTYGHVVGDRVLTAVAGAARRILREGDVLIRYGGEEFMILLVGASAEDGATISERLRRSVAETIVIDGDQKVGVTVSIGIAAMPGDDIDSEQDLIEQADAALYAAKDRGRDRVVVA